MRFSVVSILEIIAFILMGGVVCGMAGLIFAAINAMFDMMAICAIITVGAPILGGLFLVISGEIA